MIKIYYLKEVGKMFNRNAMVFKAILGFSGTAKFKGTFMSKIAYGSPTLGFLNT